MARLSQPPAAMSLLQRISSFSVMGLRAEKLFHANVFGGGQDKHCQRSKSAVENLDLHAHFGHADSGTGIAGDKFGHIGLDLFNVGAHGFLVGLHGPNGLHEFSVIRTEKAE
jgi:hypothetical protein